PVRMCEGAMTGRSPRLPCRPKFPTNRPADQSKSPHVWAAHSPLAVLRLLCYSSAPCLGVSSCRFLAGIFSMSAAGRVSLYVLVAVGLCGMPGCSGPFYWPWEKRDVIDPVLYEKSAAFRVEKVRKQCDGIAKLSRPDQDRIAAELAAQF